jgi:hypothetical protein
MNKQEPNTYRMLPEANRDFIQLLGENPDQIGDAVQALVDWISILSLRVGQLESPDSSPVLRDLSARASDIYQRTPTFLPLPPKTKED